MTRRVSFFSAVLVLLVLGVANGQERPGLGVMDIAPLDPDDRSLISASRVISQLVRHELAATGAFEIVERERMQDILRVQGFGLTGCTSDSCVIEIGRLLNAPKMAVGTLGRLGRKYVLTLRIIDVELGIWESHGVEEGIYELEDLGRLVKPLVKQIVSGEGTVIEEDKELPVTEEEQRPKREEAPTREVSVPSREKRTRVLITLAYGVIHGSPQTIGPVTWDEVRITGTVYAMLQRPLGKGPLWWGSGLVLNHTYAEPERGQMVSPSQEVTGGTLDVFGVFFIAALGGPTGGRLQGDLKLGWGVVNFRRSAHVYDSLTGLESGGRAVARPFAYLAAPTLSVRVTSWLSLVTTAQIYKCSFESEEFEPGKHSPSFFSLQTGVTVTL